MASRNELIQSIASYRGDKPGRYYDPQIGAIFLRDVRFFPTPSVQLGTDIFTKNQVKGKGFEVEELGPDHPLMDALSELFSFKKTEVNGTPLIVPGPVFGDERLVKPRLGQSAFKALVLTAYGGRCAITGDKIRPVLQAAHIRPVAYGGENRVDNGLLLRSDVHTLFDRGYLGLDLSYRLRVSPAIRVEFDNGDEFYTRAGHEIALPDRRADRPNRDFLEWHNDLIFKTA